MIVDFTTFAAECEQDGVRECLLHGLRGALLRLGIQEALLASSKAVVQTSSQRGVVIVLHLNHGDDGAEQVHKSNPVRQCDQVPKERCHQVPQQVQVLWSLSWPTSLFIILNAKRVLP